MQSTRPLRRACRLISASNGKAFGTPLPWLLLLRLLFCLLDCEVAGRFLLPSPRPMRPTHRIEGMRGPAHPVAAPPEGCCECDDRKSS